jgi:hypothetical protein
LASAKTAPKRRVRANSPSTRTRRGATSQSSSAAAAPSTAAATASAPGSADLAAGLRTYLSAVEAEVRAVSGLSERIDALVTELNDVRDQQAKRLQVLDELRASVSDASLGAFLNQAIKPRKTRVREVVPERLNQ